MKATIRTQCGSARVVTAHISEVRTECEPSKETPYYVILVMSSGNKYRWKFKTEMEMQKFEERVTMDLHSLNVRI